MPSAALYDAVGGPEVLYIADVPTPAPADGEVVVRVHAGGINPIDRKLRTGFLPAPDGLVFPRGIGCDFAGVILSAAPGTTLWDGRPAVPGDEVLGWTTPGALREELVVAAECVARKPSTLDVAIASALPTPGLTALASLDQLGIDGDDTILVSAAAGSVGIIYSQLALRRGATVIGTARTRNHALLRDLGVIPVEYGAGLADRVRMIAPSPVTAVQDNHGIETVQAGLELGVAAERICTVVPYESVPRYGVRTPRGHLRQAKDLQGLADLAATGSLVIPIAGSFALEDVADAFRAHESGELTGKIVVTV